jgi:ubiquinone/menaquinone biosynthesis C-methylase UbiE
MPTLEYDGRIVERLGPGKSTAGQLNVRYRLEKLTEHCLIGGKFWLDCGCAEGGYAIALADRGAKAVVGIDIEFDRLQRASDREEVKGKKISFCQSLSERMPFPDATFDGVLINEVLEHVINELDTLEEIYRILRPGGVIALISPNRWFPFEGHGATISKNMELHFPTPILPWLPKAIGNHFMNARNYWPHELEGLALQAGFNILARMPILAVMEFHRWMPQFAIKWYQSSMPQIERIPLLRQLSAVSTLVIGQRPS